MATGEVTLNAGKDLLPVQKEAIRTRARIIGLFGGWGSGKTRGGANGFLVNCLANPWTPDYGESTPISIVIGLTHKVLKDSAHREFTAVCPPILIRKELKNPDWTTQLENGHTILWRTVAGAVEGQSACTVWLDEAHLLKSPATYLNYQMRVRDPNARRHRTYVTGLPEFGWLQETFGPGTDTPSKQTILASTYDNHYLPPHVIPDFKASCSLRDADRYLRGQWMSTEGAIYYEWAPEVHLVDDPGDKAEPVRAISIDVGETGAVLWFQERKHRGPRYDNGLHVVDEILPTKQSAKATIKDVLARGWGMRKGYTRIYVDPATDRDELDAIYDAIPSGVDVIRKKKGDKPYYVEYGIRCVNTALTDASQRTRLTVFSGLPRTPRSLIPAMTKYHRNPRGQPVKDNITDHVLDTLRMPVADLLPLKRTGIENF